MREVRESKPSKVGASWLPAQHSRSVVLHCGFSALAAARRSLLLPNCEGLHSVRLYRTANRHAVILCSHWSIHRSVAALIFQSTNGIHIQNAESNSPIFASLEVIRPEVAISWQLFLSHNVCLNNIYQHLWRHAVFFKPQTEKSYHGKTVKYAVFPGFCARKLQTFYQIVCLVFFLYFFISWDGPWHSIRNLGVFLCFCERFECVCQL